MNRLKVMSNNYSFCNRNLCSFGIDCRIHSIKYTQIRYVHKLTKNDDSPTNASDNINYFPIKPIIRTNITHKGVFTKGNSVFLSHQNFLNFTSTRQYSDEASRIPQAPPHIELSGIFKDFSESAVVEFTQNSLAWLHTTTGLPWWATIIISSWILRTCITLPLAIYQQVVQAKLYNLKYELDEISLDLKEKARYAMIKHKWTESQCRTVLKRTILKKRKELIERDNCHPVKGQILILIQLPMWLTLSAALRNMCYMLPKRTEEAHQVYTELASGGFGWITDLTVPDHYWIVPVAIGLINFSIIEMTCAMRQHEPNKFQKFVINFSKGFALLMIPLSAYVPASMSLYWVSSSACGIVQHLLLASPKLRELKVIPTTDVDLENPYKVISERLRKKFGFKFQPSLINNKKIIDTTKSDTKTR